MERVRVGAGWLLAACGILTVAACNQLPTVSEKQTETELQPGAPRQLMSLETEISLHDLEKIEANLPESLTESEAETLLQRLPADAVLDTDASRFALTALTPRGFHGYRAGSLGRRFSWTRGFAPRWQGSWANYLYYPVGSFYFPYVYSAGNYWRYRSAYSPFFYFTDGRYRPYYRSRWW